MGLTSESYGTGFGFGANLTYRLMQTVSLYAGWDWYHFTNDVQDEADEVDEADEGPNGAARSFASFPAAAISRRRTLASFHDFSPGISTLSSTPWACSSRSARITLSKVGSCFFSPSGSSMAMACSAPVPPGACQRASMRSRYR